MSSYSLLRGFCLAAVALFAVYADTAPPSGAGAVIRGGGRHCEDGLLTCQIVTESTRYETGDEIDQTTCIRVVDGIPTSASYYVTIPKEVAETYKISIEDGTLLLSICGARLVADAVVLEDDAQFTILDTDFFPDGKEREGRRQLLENKQATDAFGERHLIAFRINGVPSDVPTVLNSKSEIHQALFGDGISVKSQYEKCSIEQLTIVSKGVYDVYLPRSLDSFESPLEVRNFLLNDGIYQYSKSYKKDHGTADVRDIAHNIVFCMPPVWAFIANA
jgi:hypothetical protein